MFKFKIFYTFDICYYLCRSAIWLRKHCHLNLSLLHISFSVFIFRPQLAGLLSSFGPNLVDARGRLLPRSYDILGKRLPALWCFRCWITDLLIFLIQISLNTSGLYSTFVFQKPNPEIITPLMTPVLVKNHNLEEVINPKHTNCHWTCIYTCGLNGFYA